MIMMVGLLLLHMAPRMGALQCPLGTVPITYCGLSPLALGRTWKDSDTLLDSSQAPNGSPHWLEAIDWAPLGLGPWYHLFTIMCPQGRLLLL